MSSSIWTIECDMLYFDQTVTCSIEHDRNTIDEVVDMIKALRCTQPHLTDSTATYYELTDFGVYILHDLADPSVILMLYLKYK